MRRATALILLALGSTGTTASAQTRAAALQAEFRQAVDVAIPRAEALRGDSARFRASVQPFGPLDLDVRRAASAEEADALRNMYLGVMGAAAGVDPTPMIARWHCGPECDRARRDTLVKRLPQLQQLLADLQEYPRVDVIAAWPDSGYRLGLVAFDGHDWSVQAESPTLGLLSWRPLASASEAVAARRVYAVSDTTAAWLAGSLRQLGLAAVVRESSGAIRCILSGSIGDNEAGLLFVPPGTAAPSAGQQAGMDGRRYNHVEAVAPGVFYYLTS